MAKTYVLASTTMLAERLEALRGHECKTAAATEGQHSAADSAPLLIELVYRCFKRADLRIFQAPLAEAHCGRCAGHAGGVVDQT